MKIRYPKQAMTLLAALFLSLPVAADESDDRAMREALEAARDHEWSRIDQAAIEDHVLAGYIEYHRLKSQLPNVAPEIVNAYLTRHADSPLSGWMRGVAQVSYGDAGRFDALLAISDGDPRGTIRQCYYYTALLDRDPQAAARGGLDLWLTGQSQPSQCNPLFDTLLSRGVIDDQAIWQRMMLAWENGEDGLMRYLANKLPASWSDAQQALGRLRGDFSAITRIPVNTGPQGQASAALFTAAMHNFTRADTEAALEAWRKIAPHLSLSEEQRHTIEHDLAFYSMVREVANNRGWVDEALPRLADGELLELRVRRALAERNWREVVHWIHQMPDDPRQDAHWQYWLGRALEQLGDAQTAKKAYAAAANERSFFGFAAADKLQQPYALDMTRASYNEAYRKEVANWPVVQRVEALYRIG